MKKHLLGLISFTFILISGLIILPILLFSQIGSLMPKRQTEDKSDTERRAPLKTAA